MIDPISIESSFRFPWVALVLGPIPRLLKDWNMGTPKVRLACPGQEPGNDIGHFSIVDFCLINNSPHSQL